MNPLDLNQRESQAGHSSAAQPVWNDDRVLWGASSLVPSATPFPCGAAGTLLPQDDFPAYPPTFQPPRAGPGSCPSTRPDLLDQNLAFKAAGSDKQPRFKYLLELVETEALSLQLPSPRGAHHLPACSPFCLPPCHRVRSEISSNT